MNINKFFVVSRYFFTLANLVSIMVVSSLEDTADFGRISFFRLVIGYLIYAEFGFVQYVFRRRAADNSISSHELSSVVSYLCISVLSFLFIFSFLDFQFDAFFDNPQYVVYASLSMVLTIASKFVIDQFRITEQINKLIMFEFLANFIIYTTVLYCWVEGVHNVDIFVAMYGLNMVPYFFFLVFSPALRRKLKKIKFNLSYDPKIIYASAMLFIFGVVSLVFASVDRIIIKYFLGYESLGLYAMAFTVSSGFYMVIQTITWINMPGFIKSIKNDSIPTSMAAFKTYMFKMQLIYLSVITLALPCYYLLINYYNPAYEDTFGLFILLSAYNYVNLFYIYHRTYLMTFEHYKALNTTLLVAVICNFIMSLSLLRFASIEILICGSIFSHIVYMMILRTVVSRRAKIACSI